MYEIFFYLRIKAPLTTLLVVLWITSFSQNVKQIDSLTSLLKESSGIQKIEPLIELAVAYSAVDYDKSLTYIAQAQDIAYQYGDSARIVRAGRLRGQLLNHVDRVKESIEILSEVLPVAKRNNFRNDYKIILNSLAFAYTLQADYDKALDYNFKTLVLREADGNPSEVSITLNNIGFVYLKLMNFERAIEYFKNSLKIKKEFHLEHEQDRVNINLGLCYNHLKNYSEAQKYFDEAFRVCGNDCSDLTRVEGQYGLGISHFGRNNFREARIHLNESYQIAKKINHKRFQVENLVYLADIAIQEKEEVTALANLLEAEALAKASGYNELLIATYREFSSLYSNLKDYENAAVYQRKYIDLKDSIYNQALIENLASVQTDYAERENKAIIASKEVVIKQQRDLNFAVAVIAILAGLLILVLQRSNRVSKQVNAKLSEAKETIQEQNRLLETKNKDLDREVEKKTADLERVNLSLKQVNDELDNFIYKTSHDIRGPLASLKGMCNVALMDVKDPIALDYLRKLDTTAERLNTILTRLLIINQINNSKLSISKIDFTGIINDILLLEKKKGLPHKLSIRTHVDVTAIIESDKELVRIVLENLIDNAIKFYNDSQRVESFVEIHIAPLKQGGVKVRVIDNGIGISESNPVKLFQMFFRASERSEIGGIGLYIVKTATAKLGGQVGLLTTPEGYTEFYVTFPSYPPYPDEGSDRQDFY